jgi:hypothetical protein
VIGSVADADVNAQLEQRFFAHARRAPGWNDAHAAGARMSFEEAIAFALGERGAGFAQQSGLNSPEG